LARGCVIGHLRTGSTGGPLIRCRSAARRRLRATVLRWPAALSVRGVGAVVTVRPRERSRGGGLGGDAV